METTQRREVNDKEFVYANQIADDIIVATITGFFEQVTGNN